MEIQVWRFPSTITAMASSPVLKNPMACTCGLTRGSGSVDEIAVTFVSFVLK